MMDVFLKKMTGLVRARMLFALAAALCFFTACEEIEEEKPWIQVERPQMLFTDTTLMDSYDGDVLNWKLKTAYLERWSDKEIVFVRPVLVDIYDSLGERVAFLRADSGSLDMKFTYVNAFGHVYALTPKGASVRADSLLWNKKDNLVKTESYVRVVSEDGDVLQGKGFESDAKMDHWRILSSVTGIFQDAAKRLKDEDKKQAEKLESDSTKAASAASAAPAATQSQVPQATPHQAPHAPPKPDRPRHERPKRISAEDSVAIEQNKAAAEKLDHMKNLREQARKRMEEKQKAAQPGAEKSAAGTQNAEKQNAEKQNVEKKAGANE